MTPEQPDTTRFDPTGASDGLGGFERLRRRIGRFPIELPAAMLLAGAVALATLALPDWRFERAVAASGLPAIVSAAQAPLGTTARIVVALGLAGLSFLAAWFGLRALDRDPRTDDFPAFRAADLHPDAPRRRPILAGAEFGRPVDELAAGENRLLRKKPAPAEPLPSFLAPQPPEIGDFVPPPPVTPRLDPVQPQDAVFEEIEAVAAPASDRVGGTPRWIEVEDDAGYEGEAPSAGLTQTAQPAWMDETVVSGARDVPDAAKVPDAPVRTTPPARLAGDFDEEEESVADLMARLESGMLRRGSAPMPALGGGEQEELRRTLGDLDRQSGRAAS